MRCTNHNVILYRELTKTKLQLTIGVPADLITRLWLRSLVDRDYPGFIVQSFAECHTSGG